VKECYAALNKWNDNSRQTPVQLWHLPDDPDAIQLLASQNPLWERYRLIACPPDLGFDGWGRVQAQATAWEVNHACS